VDGPQAPPADNGIGGLFANAEPLQPSMTLVPPRTPAQPPRTSVFPVSSPPAAQPPAAPPSGRFSYWTEASQAGEVVDEEPGSGSGKRALLMGLAGAVVVAALLVGGWLFLRDATDDDGGGGTPAGSTSAEVESGTPEVGAVQEVGGVSYTLEAAETESTCVGHAYGDTADFFAGNDCTGLSRALYSADIGGEPVVVSVTRVRMADAAAARDLRSLTDRNGSGNVSDLLREGVRYTGSPAELSGAEYASAVSGTTVTIVEAAWVADDADGSSADIDQAAADALALQVRAFP
jgi:hypothetical protein